MNDGSSLPTDLEQCHRLIEQLQQQLQSREAFVHEQSQTVVELDEVRTKLSQQNEELKATVQKLLGQLYGRRSERFVDPDQLHLGFDQDDPEVIEALEEAVREAEEALDDLNQQKRGRSKSKPKGDQKFPEHLPRYEVTVEIPDAEARGLRLIGYDDVESLELVSAQLRVRRTRYAKYARANQEIVSVERPVGLVEGNRFDTSVAVEVIASRFFYHLPYYRQQDLFASHGWTPSRSTLLNLVTATEFVLQPLVDHYRSLLKHVSVLQCDETPVTLIVPPSLPALDPDDPRTPRITEVLSEAQAKGRPSVAARIWAYRAVDLPFNLFDFTVSRHRDGPDEILSTFTGVLLGDCWTGFQKIELRSHERIRRAACWAHARRKFDACRMNHPQVAPKVLAFLRELYDLETRAKLWSIEHRLELRQNQSLRVLEQLRTYLAGPASERLLPKSDLADAIRYVQNNWDALVQFTSNGQLPIDNNECEQLMKQIATGRKNWLHVGSVAAGQRAANLMTIISTAARNDLDVHAYLKDILDQILAGCTDWDSLRADRWKEQHPEAIRTYRADERRDAIDRRQARRAQRRILERKRKK